MSAPSSATLNARPAESEIVQRPGEASSAKSKGIAEADQNSLQKIDSSQKNAGLNRGKGVSKSAMYAAAIHANLSKRSEKLGEKFLAQFSKNLMLTKQSNNEAIKPAAHKSLNDLVIQGEISANDAKQIANSAWKVVYRDIPKAENRPTRVKPRTLS